MASIYLSLIWIYIQTQKESYATIITSSIKKDLSLITYNTHKQISKKENLYSIRSMLNRFQASNDFISEVFITDANKVLVSTNYKIKNLPKPLDYFIEEDSTPLQILQEKKIFNSNFHIYELNKKIDLKIFVTLDSQSIQTQFFEPLNTLLLVLILIGVISISIIYFFTTKFLALPLEKLRQYAYYQSTIPKRFFLQELEYIRSSMYQTFTRLEDEKAQLYKVSRTDSLSGLNNREALSEKLSLLIENAKREDKEFALIFLDLDNFKNVNDFHGHQVGDELLKKISIEIQKSIRTNDIIARVGGDEFVAVLTSYKSYFELIRVIQRIQNIMKNPMLIQDHLLEITSSAGIAFYPKDGTNQVELMKNADIAMYQAKKNGKNQYSFFTEDLNTKIKRDISLVADMKTALAENQFELYYQPKTDVKNSAIIGCEALIRWNHPIQGLIPPNDFIPLAEENTMMVDLGLWILEEAIRQQVIWKDTNVCDIPISINVSVTQLFHKNFSSDLTRLINKYRVKPEKIDLEIVESVFLYDKEKTTKLFNTIHQLGCSISLDDFGTGYSSLSYLKDFQLETIKIDKIFIDDFQTESGSIFLATIIKMGQTLKLEVLCEGVETEEQLRYLQSLNCNSYQGYFYSKPLPAQEFELLF